MKNKNSKFILTALLAMAFTSVSAFAEGSSGNSSGNSSPASSSKSKEVVVVPRVVRSDYASLEQAARDRLANLIADGAGDGRIVSATQVLRDITTAHYLESSAKVTDPIVGALEGLKPQLAVLPDLIKGAILTQMKTGDLPPIAIESVKKFLSADNKVDAQVSVGDVLRLLPAVAARDKAMAMIPAPSTATTPQDRQKLELAQKTAGDTAFNQAWKAAKASEDIAGLPTGK